ncbi:hypothetical protein OUM_1284 [Helicobacter pylori R038b]|uniref:Uncharacterized protein n=1 Tax=Helicobacter pylori R038b TaxID=1145115 RepID=K2KS64_HELPX|nr:hypothetical protein OUM_1284 [Helicobacter pylori R038b]
MRLRGISKKKTPKKGGVLSLLVFSLTFFGFVLKIENALNKVLFVSI